MILNDKLEKAYNEFKELNATIDSRRSFKRVVRALLVEEPRRTIQKMDVEILNATDIKIDGYEYVLKEEPKCKHTRKTLTQVSDSGYHSTVNKFCPDCGEKL